MYVNLMLVISCILCFFILFIALRKADKCGTITDTNDFIVRRPKGTLGVFITMTIFFLLLYTVSIISIEYDPVKKLNFALGFFPVILLGNFPVILWIRWKIIVKDKQVTFTPYFGRKKIFAFDYITMAKYGITVVTLKGKGMVQRDTIKAYHEKKKLFYLDDSYPGFHVLVQRLKDEGVNIVW